MSVPTTDKQKLYTYYHNVYNCLYIIYTIIIYRLLLYFRTVFHNSVHYIHCDARWRDIMLYVPTKSADNYAARDAQDHKVLRR